MGNMPPVSPAHGQARHRGTQPWGPAHGASADSAAFLFEAAQARQRIREHLLREVEAMALFAAESGIGVPQDVLVALDRACGDAGAPAPAPPANPPEHGDAPHADEPPHLAPPAHGPELAEQIALLADVHVALTRLVAPARPGTLVLLTEQKRRHALWNRFGAVPLVRQMLALAVVSLAIMLGTALSPQVNAANMAKGLMALQGWALLVNEVFLLAAAAVGASLTNLKHLDRYVSACTYDPRYESSYWSRLVMGLISGVILSQLIFSALISGTPPPGNNPDVMSTLGQPILALLGGFSADVVYGILQHLISVVGNLFAGGKLPPPKPKPPDPGVPHPPLVVAETVTAHSS